MENHKTNAFLISHATKLFRNDFEKFPLQCRAGEFLYKKTKT